MNFGIIETGTKPCYWQTGKRGAATQCKICEKYGNVFSTFKHENILVNLKNKINTLKGGKI